MLQPINEKIFVKKHDEEFTEGGIVMPSTSNSDTAHGEVMAMGKGAFATDGSRIEPSVKVGDKVMFMPKSARKVRSEGVDLFVVTEREIIGYFE